MITTTPKTISLDTGVLEEVERTRGKNSTSQRINDLLKAGLAAERELLLEREAAEFFSSDSDRPERRAFQAASIRSLSRDE